MQQHGYGVALRHVQTLFNIGTMGGLTDGQLLDRFASGHGEPAELAFAALVERHGPMVLRVCQSVLRERHDAEDAFQATFLILVRKAASIRKQNSVVSWLHGVAFRVASCQKGGTARRRKHERTVAERAITFVEADHQDDVSELLHKELDRLPEKYRKPIILCYFESLSHEQAARQLRWPVGTVRSRLARGREQLRRRLELRGLAPSCAFLERALRVETGRAAIPSALATATAHAARHYGSSGFVATGVTSTSVASLIEGFMHMLVLAKMKVAIVAGGLITASALVVAQQVDTALPAAKVQAARADNPENRLADSGALDADAVVARELGQLDLDLMAADVHQLRKQVEVAVRNKIRAERKNSGLAGEAQLALEVARADYLTKARELRTAQRQFENARSLHAPGSERSVGVAPPRDDPNVQDLPARKPGQHASAAAIGSIDMEAVFHRYEKVKSSNKEYNAALLARKSELKKIMAEAQDEAQVLSKLATGSDDYVRREKHLTDLKARHEAQRELAESEFAQRQARMTAEHLEEIHAVVSALAKAKGLNYVVKVSPGTRHDSAPVDVIAALNHSVVYADPRNDLTEEVIRELNRDFPRFQSNTGKE